MGTPRRFKPVLIFFFFLFSSLPSVAQTTCTQALLEGGNPPTTQFTITPKTAVQPFYEWYTNGGYCGEVSVLQAGLASGQWISQFNARLICGSGLSQSGPDGFCAANQQNMNYNAQVLLESSVAGDSPFASAPQCLANFRLKAESFEHSTEHAGLDGYRQYMSWVKAHVIAGDVVAITVLHYGERGPEYDHIVTVSQIGTNHSVWDATYYDDDVLYFEDHGSLTIIGNELGHEHPSIPIAAQNPSEGCNPFYFGYTFAALPHTREDANGSGALRYSIIIPGVFPTPTQTGGDGINPNPTPIVGGNYAVAVSGPMDDHGVTLPVSLKLAGSRLPDGSVNPPDPIGGFGYENPTIGSSDDYCTNTPPAQWMTLDLDVTVSGLVAGKAYNLYRYDFDHIEGVASAAALPVPSADFNAHANLATQAIHFVATGPTYSTALATPSENTVLFRAVSSDSP